MAMRSLLQDWGLETKVKIHSDSAAARSFSNRRGLGKQRHVQARFLWIQERVAKKHMAICKVAGTDNHSDILTKAVAGTLLDKHLARMNLHFREGHADKQKLKLLSTAHPSGQQ